MNRDRAFPLLLSIVLAACTSIAAENHGFRVPDGFDVSLFADDSMAHDIFSMTVDAKGRVAVAGRSYVKILEDSDGDGRADKATLFSKLPNSGAHGMCFDGNDLICTGDNSLWRFRDQNGDGIADDKPEVWLANIKHSEHAANGVVRGPDGWFYLACGNDAGITTSHVTLPGSPVKQPNAGAMVRISPDGKSSEVVAHGFRNPYDLDFNSYGNLFTYDADGERDHHLPWYTPTRIFDIAQGQHHGWVLKGFQHAWNKPSKLFDVVDRLYEVGRGSPTGVAVYRHNALPARYRDGLFAVCWTFGRVYFFPLQRDGSSYKAEMEIFMETIGDTGFAPVDIAVGKAGEMYVAIGGRGTAGGVFCVKYKSGANTAGSRMDSPLEAVLGAAQPLSSWSRAAWIPRAEKLGRTPFESAAQNKKLPAIQRIRALEILVELFGGVSADLASRVSGEAIPELTARAIWALSRSADSELARRFLVRMTAEKNPQVARAAWEALGALPSPLEQMAPDWKRGLAASDRRVRAAAVSVAQSMGKNVFPPQMQRKFKTPREQLGLLMSHSGVLLETPSRRTDYFARCLDVISKTDDPQLRTGAVRLLQIALGDFHVVQDKPTIHDGLIARNPTNLSLELRQAVSRQIEFSFPDSDSQLNRETARLLAMLESPDVTFPEKMSVLWTAQSPIEDDIHFLAVLSRLPASQSSNVTYRSAQALVRLHHKMAKERKEPSRMWPVHVAQLFDFLQRRDPGVARAMIDHLDFGLPEHALFAKMMATTERNEAARKFLARIQNPLSQNAAVTPELIELLSVLPISETIPTLRSYWSQSALRDAIVLILAKAPQPEDRARFVEALSSFQSAIVERAAGSLLSLEFHATPDEIGAALQNLRRLATTSERAACEALSRLLVQWTGQKTAVEKQNFVAAQAAWQRWFEQNHPAQARQLPGSDELDSSAWQARLQTIDWATGSAERGRKIFEDRSCSSCHSGARKFGPDLAGVAARFSQADLFMAIVDPNRDVSPAYYPKVIRTHSGESYSGTIVYESPALTLLQTAPDTTVRIAGSEVAAITASRLSPMPAGLLNGLTDLDLTDLYALLQTMRK